MRRRGPPGSDHTLMTTRDPSPALHADPLSRLARELAAIASPWVYAEALDPSPKRPVATFSIVARDADTGEMGVAVQSHWFSVGSIVPWAEAGVGAVATQSFVEPSYGPLGLALMKQGVPAADALSQLTAKDAHPDVRQVAFVDAQGRVGSHTGKNCIPGAGFHVGKEIEQIVA